MKTNLLCAIATAVTALTLASSAYAGYTPVGADGITASPRLRQMLNDRPASVSSITTAAVPSMACPKCADVRIAKLSPQAKGSEIMMGVKHVSYSHACSSCSTKLTVAGEGKAKHQVAAHKCADETPNNLACCAAK